MEYLKRISLGGNPAKELDQAPVSEIRVQKERDESATVPTVDASYTSDSTGDSETLNDAFKRAEERHKVRSLRTRACLENLNTINKTTKRTDQTVTRMAKQLDSLQKSVGIALGPGRNHVIEENARLRRKCALQEKELKKHGLRTPLTDISASSGDQLISKVKKSGEHVERHSSKNHAVSKSKKISNTQKSRGLYTGA